MPDPEFIEVVSRRTGKKSLIPRKRFERHPDLFKLPPSKRNGGRQSQTAIPVMNNPAKPVESAATDNKEAADGAQTEPRTD